MTARTLKGLRLAPGKVPADVLERLLDGLPPGRGVRVGPGLGLDAAVLEVPAGLLVAASDPVTFATDEIGWYAVHVNANDVACMGGEPLWFTATVLLPGGADATLAGAIQSQMVEALSGLGAALIGGHTEVLPDLTRPVVCGTMLGCATREVSPARARAGDELLLAGAAAIEATAIIARERVNVLEPRVGAELVRRARDFLHDPGISVVQAAKAALAAGADALHDPTEGGVWHGIRELCAASGTGIVVDDAAIVVLPETRAVCQAFDIDPLAAISSGALLIASPPEHAEAIRLAVAAAGVTCARVGRLLPPAEGLSIVCASGRTEPFPSFAGDEIGKLFVNSPANPRTVAKRRSAKGQGDG
ncbi:MAG: hydrogenase expression protein [Gemmatimonadetes bacterium]|nr:hydrogenase expression protein [Gemmatimonadota bacterium]